MGGGGTGDPDPPPGKLQNIGFLSKTGKLHSIQCLAIDGPLMVVFYGVPKGAKR